MTFSYVHFEAKVEAKLGRLLIDTGTYDKIFLRYNTIVILTIASVQLLW